MMAHGYGRPGAHAPSLMVPEQIEVIRKWLATDQSKAGAGATSQRAELNH